MTKRVHRPQKSELVIDDAERPLPVASPHPDDRLHNPKDLDPPAPGFTGGMEHGGTIESRAEALQTRGDGGRKRARAGAPSNKGRPGRDISKGRK